MLDGDSEETSWVCNISLKNVLNGEQLAVAIFAINGWEISQL